MISSFVKLTWIPGAHLYYESWISYSSSYCDFITFNKVFLEVDWLEIVLFKKDVTLLNLMQDNFMALFSWENALGETTQFSESKLVEI